jgi:hypothetical protein
MSSNRLLYDDCASDNQNNANKDQLSWIVDDNRFQNSTNCMIDLGVSSGNTSLNNNISDRVDIETKLRGIGNYESKCKGMSKIEEQNNVLPTCNFYNGSLKPASLGPNETLTTNRCNNKVE